MRLQVTLLAGLLSTACGGSTPGPGADNGGETTGSSPSTESPRVAGGYSEKAIDAEDVKATADRAVTLLRARTGDESLTLQRIERAETQVVAGRNTRLTLAITGDEGERPVTVVVYRNLQGEESLTSVEGL